MRNITGTAACLALCFLACAPAARAQNGQGAKKTGPETREAVRHDISPRLERIPPARINAQSRIRSRGPLPQQNSGSGRPDSVIQATAAQAQALAANSGLNILGVGNGFAGPQGSYSVSTVPSDANGAAGPTQYVRSE